MKPWTLSRLLVLCAVSAACWLGIAAICLSIGSTGWGWPADAFIRGDRLRNVVVASLVGGALAAAGATYQAVLRNPLADPYLLGVSSGATLVSYLWAVTVASSVAWIAAFTQQSAAFVGALGALSIVLLVAQRRGRLEPVTLLLVGVIVSAICAAIYLLVYHLNMTREVTFGTGGPFRFLVGGINTNLGATQIQIAAAVVAVGWVALLYLSGQLNVAALGEDEAEALGVRIHRLRWAAMGVASIITAAAVAISGPIGFVGLICPHVARLLAGSDQRKVLPLATAVGASLLALADAVSRGLAPRTSGILPVGVLTGMLGGPFFLLLLWRRRGITSHA